MPDQETILTFLIGAGLRIGAAALLFIVGRRLARYLRDRLGAVLRRSGSLTDSIVLLLTTLTYYGIVLLTILVGLAILGVPVAFLVSMVAVVVVILGVAFQQSLGNFAATIIFLLFKPFTVGEDIETMGVFGTVQEIQFFNTVLLPASQKVVILPNAKIQDAGVTNFSRKGILRVDEVVSISYGDDLRRAMEILTAILEADPRVLAEPPAQIAVVELAESGVNIAVRPYVKYTDYWNMQFALREVIKLRFDEAGITIPFPQRVITLEQKSDL